LLGLDKNSTKEARSSLPDTHNHSSDAVYFSDSIQYKRMAIKTLPRPHNHAVAECSENSCTANIRRNWTSVVGRGLDLCYKSQSASLPRTPKPALLL